MVWRCEKTGNPVGTDTQMIGAPDCQCQGCRAHRDLRTLRVVIRTLAPEGSAAEFKVRKLTTFAEAEAIYPPF